MGSKWFEIKAESYEDLIIRFYIVETSTSSHNKLPNMDAVWLNFPRPEHFPLIVTQATTPADFLAAVKFDRAEKRGYLPKTASEDLEMLHPIFSLLNDEQHERTETKSNLIESKMKAFQQQYPTEISKLLREFYSATADIEFQKLGAVMEYPRPYHSRIISYYNHLRQLLIYRTERILDNLIKYQRSVQKNANKNRRVLRGKRKSPQTSPQEVQTEQAGLASKRNKKGNSANHFSPY